jgi:putative ABC transport system ATP-binding protein
VPGSRIVLEHVNRSHGATRVLRDVSFVVEPGEVVALTGPSGSGKTTLLQLIGSLDRPTSGAIYVDDIPVHTLRHPAKFRRDVVGFVFQLHHLLPELNVQENVELTMVAAHVPRRERHARAKGLLDEVGLGERLYAFPADLSGGERQRVAIARALGGQPRLILADEPTGSLDSDASDRIWNLLVSLRERHGTTILIASHDPTLREHVDRSLSISDGHVTDSPATARIPASRGATEAEGIA